VPITKNKHSDYFCSRKIHNNFFYGKSSIAKLNGCRDAR
jgi:hypothetical protein